MEKPELTSAIKSAIEHGSSLENAKNSLIAAGYSSSDVEYSAQTFSGITSVAGAASAPQLPFSLRPPRSDKAKIILIIAGILVLTALGVISLIILF